MQFAINGKMYDAFVAVDGNGIALNTGTVGADRSTALSTTSKVLMPANSSRAKMIIKNDSTIDIWINFDAAAVAVAGSGSYRIASGGGYFELDRYTGAVNAIAASGTPAVSAREF